MKTQFHFQFSIKKQDFPKTQTHSFVTHLQELLMSLYVAVVNHLLSITKTYGSSQLQSYKLSWWSKAKLPDSKRSSGPLKSNINTSGIRFVDKGQERHKRQLLGIQQYISAAFKRLQNVLYKIMAIKKSVMQQMGNEMI